MAKEGETLFFYLPTCLVNFLTCHLPTCLFSSSTRQLVNFSTRKYYPIQLELCKKTYKVLLVVIKLLTLCIYLQTN